MVRIAVISTLFVLSYLAVGSSAAAESIGGAMEGKVVLAKAAFSGAVEMIDLNQSVIAVHGDQRRPATSWIAAADEVTVNWTRFTFHSVGRNPYAPDEPLVSFEKDRDTGEKKYAAADVSFVEDGRWSHQVFLVDAIRRGALIATGESELAPADGEPWRAGHPRDATGLSAGHEKMPLEQFPVPAGVPVVSVSKGSLSIAGDFVVYLWDGALKVDPADGAAANYRAGVWHESKMGPANGAAYEEHRQLLRLTFTNATLHFGNEQSGMRIAQPEIAANIVGTLSGFAQEGEVRSGDEAYRLNAAKFEMTGVFKASAIDDSDDESMLQVSLSSDAGSFESPDIRAENAIATAAGPSANGFAVPSWTPMAGAAGGVLIAAAMLVLLSAFLVTRHRDARTAPMIHYAMAEQALMERRPRKARRHARWIIRSHPHDGNGWFLTAASYAQEKAYRRLIQAVAPAVDQLDAEDKPSVAFLLAVACDRLDRVEQRRRWARIAAKDETMRARMAEMGLHKAANTPSGRDPRRAADGLVAYV